MKTMLRFGFLCSVAICLAGLIGLSGCAKFRNQVAADGGLVGSYTGNYIVRNDSGGRIMDMWVLSDVIVQSEFSGAGWLFRDKSGNVIHLGGDVKVMRLKDLSLISDYHEYHAEFETKTYQELHTKPK